MAEKQFETDIYQNLQLSIAENEEHALKLSRQLDEIALLVEEEYQPELDKMRFILKHLEPRLKTCLRIIKKIKTD